MSFTLPKKEEYFFYIYDVIVKQKKNALYITTHVFSYFTLKGLGR